MGPKKELSEKDMKSQAIHVGSWMIEDADGNEHQCIKYGDEEDSGSMRQQRYVCIDCQRVFKEVWANVGILDTEEGEYLKEERGERVVGELKE